MMLRVVLVVCLLAVVAQAFRAPAARRATLAPLKESFGLEISTVNDPAKASPSQLLSEDSYRKFVGEFDDGALINKVGIGASFASGGSSEYDVLDRVRSLKLLTLTAESGLLEALEARGVTLAQVEKLLPLVDQLGLLELVKGNKALLASAAPLLIEPAPGLIPVLVSVLKTSPVTFQAAGAAVAGGGLFEVTQGNALLGAPLVLLGAPLLVLGTVLGSLGSSLPSASSYSAASSPAARSSDGGMAPRVKAPTVKAAAAPTVKAAAAPKAGGAPRAKNGARKTIRVNR